jgi:hypothetical protein
MSGDAFRLNVFGIKKIIGGENEESCYCGCVLIRSSKAVAGRNEPAEIGRKSRYQIPINSKV